ncbi:putative leader peptide [Rhodococcus artemisiae]|uniref:putative leader peptide n=1 Tax=Rhodococcus artemisiae TaxID=714159 RepID=UPI0038B5FED0
MPNSANSALAVSRSRSAGGRLAGVSTGVRTQKSLSDRRDRQTVLYRCILSPVTRCLLTRRLHVDLVRVTGAACCHFMR